MTYFQKDRRRPQAVRYTPDPAALALVLADLEKVIADLSLQEATAMIGELERLKALAWTRMTNASAPGGGQPEAPAADRLSRRPPKELSPREIGARLGLSPRSVHALLRTKRLPGYRVGRLWRVNEAELQAWVERQRKGLDTGGNTVLSSGHDEARGSAGPARPGAVSVEIRGAPRRAQADGPPMGGGALPRQRARRAADPATRGTAGGPGEPS